MGRLASFCIYAPVIASLNGVAIKKVTSSIYSKR